MNLKGSELVCNTAQRLMKESGNGMIIDLVPISHGGNNRSWRLETCRGYYFLKHYFYSVGDERDRFGTELLFLNYAWGCGIRNIPKPITADRAGLIAVFSFLKGEKVGADKVDERLIEYSSKFIFQLNRENKCISAQSLPRASESCFSMAEHMALMDKRIRRLRSADYMDSIGKDAHDFIENRLYPKWQQVSRRIVKKVQRKMDMREIIRREEMVLSPSDFGFHNAILAEDNQLFFIDFEYAGWDDPAKMVCDFFSQPQVPVNVGFLKQFFVRISDIAGGGDEIRESLLWRIKLLFPLYRLKWCCIMLNDFLTSDRERKIFASYNDDKRKDQLKKAEDYLKDINDGIHGFYF